MKSHRKMPVRSFGVCAAALLFLLTGQVSATSSGSIPDVPPTAAAAAADTSSGDSLSPESEAAALVNTVCVELHSLVYNTLFLGGYPETFAGMYIDWENEALTIGVTDWEAVGDYQTVLDDHMSDVVTAALAAAAPELAAQYDTHTFVRFVQQAYSLNELNTLKSRLEGRMTALSLSSVGVDAEANCVEVVVSPEDRAELEAYLTALYTARSTETNAAGEAASPVRILEGELATMSTVS